MLPELAERLETHLQLGRDSPELGTMRGESELESGCYFLLQDDRSGSLQDPALRQWLGQLLNPVALMGRVAPELQRGWTSALGLLPHWREALPAPLPTSVQLPGRLVLACFNQHLEFNECANAMSSLLAEQGIRLEVRTLDYGRWVSGEDEDVDLWLGTLNLEHAGPFAPYAWLQGTPLLRKVWGSQHELWQGLMQWRASRCRAWPPRPAGKGAAAELVCAAVSPLAGAGEPGRRARGADDGARLVRFSQCLAAARAAPSARRGAIVRPISVAADECSVAACVKDP